MIAFLKTVHLPFLFTSSPLIVVDFVNVETLGSSVLNSSMKFVELNKYTIKNYQQIHNEQNLFTLIWVVGSPTRAEMKLFVCSSVLRMSEKIPISYREVI